MICDSAGVCPTPAVIATKPLTFPRTFRTGLLRAVCNHAAVSNFHNTERVHVSNMSNDLPLLSLKSGAVTLSKACHERDIGFIIGCELIVDQRHDNSHQKYISLRRSDEVWKQQRRLTGVVRFKLAINLLLVRFATISGMTRNNSQRDASQCAYSTRWPHDPLGSSFAAHPLASLWMYFDQCLDRK